MSETFDAIVIGAGMSGLASGIRLSMFGKKVCILERHSISGGLNSYYKRRDRVTKEFIHFDSGLHAMTNFIKKGEKGKPLSKLLKQLRISYDDLKLQEQTHSKIKFNDTELSFSNDFETLKNDIKNKFADHFEDFMKLVNHIEAFNELDLNLEFKSAKEVISSFIKDPLLKEMIIAPLLIYGSAWENDMDFSQFVIMFKSIYFEGFARPEGGVRRLLSILLNRLKEEGADLRFRSGVKKILVRDKKAVGVELLNGEEIFANKIFSSMGYPETVNILSDDSLYEVRPAVGPMTFMETIMIFNKKIPLSMNDSTIIFYNEDNKYHYEGAKDFYDPRSAVICFPDNYDKKNREGDGTVRVTYMANYELWKSLERADYVKKKKEVLKSSYDLLRKIVPDFTEPVRMVDVFSPTTIKRYTWKERGTVYGSTDKTRDGRTKVDGLYIIGTDQGFLGIVGSILSGISITNLYGLMDSVSDF